ncbi:MAG TPA: hypothetical protein VGW38_08230 [Chloroflexota bacterium]|nr:hypothetical protein [Chloroflexota bacterium]
MRTRVVVVTRHLHMFFRKGTHVPAAVLFQSGDYEPLDPSLDPLDDAAIAAHYGVDEVAHAPVVPWCVGIAEDGPNAGQEMYAIRRIGAQVGTSAGTYEVFDTESEVVRLRYTGPGGLTPA